MLQGIITPCCVAIDFSTKNTCFCFTVIHRMRFVLLNFATRWTFGEVPWVFQIRLIQAIVLQFLLAVQCNSQERLGSLLFGAFFSPMSQESKGTPYVAYFHQKRFDFNVVYVILLRLTLLYFVIAPPDCALYSVWWHNLHIYICYKASYPAEWNSRRLIDVSRRQQKYLKAHKVIIFPSFLLLLFFLSFFLSFFFICSTID